MAVFLADSIGYIGTFYVLVERSSAISDRSGRYRNPNRTSGRRYPFCRAGGIIAEYISARPTAWDMLVARGSRVNVLVECRRPVTYRSTCHSQRLAAVLDKLIRSKGCTG